MRKYCVAAAGISLVVGACTTDLRVASDGDAGLDATVVDADLDAALDVVAKDQLSDRPIDALPDRIEGGSLKDSGLNCMAPQIECGGQCKTCEIGPDAADGQYRMATCGTDGGCTTTCKPTATVCGSGESATCANLDSDPATCGGCNLRCGLGKGSSVMGTCNAGKCVPAAIAEPSSGDSALVISSNGVMLFHKGNQIHSCTLPACTNPNALYSTTVYGAPLGPFNIATPATPPLPFFVASEVTDAGATSIFLARCNLNGCMTPTKHLARATTGIAGDGSALFLTDGAGLVQHVEVGSAAAVTTLTTASSAVSSPVLSPTHIYFYQSGVGIRRCPRTGSCTPETIVSSSGTVNVPYDVVNDTLFYAENSSSPNASRVLSCSVATTPAQCELAKVRVLADSLPSVASVTADAKAVYFTNKGVSVCTDLVQGCTGAGKLGGFVPAEAEHSGAVRVSGEFIYWVQVNNDTAKSVKIMRVHVPY